MQNLEEQKARVRVLARQQRYAEALDVYLEIARDPDELHDDPAYWVELAELQRRAGRDDALESYRESIRIFLEAGQGNNAIALCRRALRHHPEATELLLQLGVAACDLGYPHDARDGLLAYAEHRAEQGETEEAVRALRRLAARFPSTRTEVDERLRALGAEPAAPPPPPMDDAPEAEPLPGLGDDDLPLQAGFQPTQLGAQPESDAFAPLEGLEPTIAGEGWGDTPPGLEPLADDRPAHAGPAEEQESLPLLGFEPAAYGDLAAPEEEPAGEPLESGAADAAEANDLPLLAPSDGLDEPAAAALPEPAPEEVRPEEPAAGYWGEAPEPERAPPAEEPGDYIDLGALLREDEEEPGEPRFLMDARPSGDEDRDLDDILRTFRRKVDEQIDPGDAASHYDLGLAFKEMGLLDDAIAQLQLALRGGSNPLATLEVLGECFLERGEPAVAEPLLARAARLPGAEEPDLVAVLYLLGRCEEALGRAHAARASYQRVVAVDLGFRDAAQRLAALPAAGDGAL